MYKLNFIYKGKRLFQIYHVIKENYIVLRCYIEVLTKQNNTSFQTHQLTVIVESMIFSRNFLTHICMIYVSDFQELSRPDKDLKFYFHILGTTFCSIKTINLNGWSRCKPTRLDSICLKMRFIYWLIRIKRSHK